MLCGVGFHRRVKGIKSESWSWDLNRLSYSNIAWLKLETYESKGDFSWRLTAIFAKMF